MASASIDLMTHLMRRAGFGAGRDELEQWAAKGYDATVEELLNVEGERPTDANSSGIILGSAVRSPLPAWGVQPGSTT